MKLHITSNSLGHAAFIQPEPVARLLRVCPRWPMAALAALVLLAAASDVDRCRAATPVIVKFDSWRATIQAPHDPAQWPAFREALAKWREEAKARVNYSDAFYRRGEFAWSTSNYLCCFLMTCDETFYDWRAGRYTVESFLDHGQREFGGYDSVVL